MLCVAKYDSVSVVKLGHIVLRQGGKRGQEKGQKEGRGIVEGGGFPGKGPLKRTDRATHTPNDKALIAVSAQRSTFQLSLQRS